MVAPSSNLIECLERKVDIFEQKNNIFRLARIITTVTIY